MGLCDGMALFSKYRINCLTLIFLGAGIGVLLLGVGVGRLASPPLILGIWRLASSRT